MATIDGSIVIISMPAIFRGIHLDPHGPWQHQLPAVDDHRATCWSRRCWWSRSAGSATCSAGSGSTTSASSSSRWPRSRLSLDPLLGPPGALWLILWRIVQAFGGAMLMANAAAILTDAFPARQRGMALGINQIAGMAGQFIGLLLGGVLAAWDWRAIFWINVPIGVFGTIWSYRKLREISTSNTGAGSTGGATSRSRSAPACSSSRSPTASSLTAATRPGWTSPRVLGGLGRRRAAAGRASA